MSWIFAISHGILPLFLSQTYLMFANIKNLASVYRVDFSINVSSTAKCSKYKTSTKEKIL